MIRIVPNWNCLVSVLERPSSQMSYLDQFLRESSSNQKSASQQSISAMQQPVTATTTAIYHGGSIESEEGDIEDNRALSIASSKSNISELSMVSNFLRDFMPKLTQTITVIGPVLSVICEQTIGLWW